MNKLRKGICYMLIVMVGIASMPVQALAATNTILDTGVVNLEDGYQLAYTEYSNGDIKFDLINKTEIVSSSYLDRSEEMVRSENLVSNTVSTYDVADEVNELSDVLTNDQEIELYATSSYTTAGSITYKLHRVREGVAYDTTGKLTMQHKKTTKNTEYNLNKKYQDFTALVAIIAGGLSLAPSIATTVAGTILNKVGFSVSVVNFLIKDYNVSAKKTTVTWKEKDASSTFSGDKYYLTYDDGSHETIYEGDYFATTSIKNKNTKFAKKAAAKYFPTFTATVKKWEAI